MQSKKNQKLLNRALRDKGQGTYQILIVILVIIAILALLLWITKNR